MHNSITAWLTASWLVIGLGSPAGAMTAAQPASVPALHFDEQCQLTSPPASPSATQRYPLAQAFPIQIREQTYQFFRVRYFDMDLLCVGDADYANAQRLDHAELKQFIETIQPDPNLANAFVLRLREGNGMTVPIRHISLAFQNSPTPIVTNLNVLQQRVITPTKSPREHRFRGKQGESFTVDFDSRTSQAIQPYMIVRTPFGSTFMEGGPLPDAPGAVQITFTLPIEGEYTIVVSNLSGPGSYMLSVNANQR